MDTAASPKEAAASLSEAAPAASPTPKPSILGQVRSYKHTGSRKYAQLKEKNVDLLDRKSPRKAGGRKFFLEASEVYPPFFRGLNPLMVEVMKKESFSEELLEEIELPARMEPRVIGERFAEVWARECARAASRPARPPAPGGHRCCCAVGPACGGGDGKPVLLFAMWRCWTRLIMLLVLPKVLRAICNILSPICLGEMLRSVEEGRVRDSTPWALLLFATAMGTSCFEALEGYLGILLGNSVRGALVSVCLAKSLRLDPGVRAEMGIGFMVNVVGTDIVTIGDAMQKMHQLWEIPCLLLLSLSVLFWKMGSLGILAMVVMAFFGPFNHWVITTSRTATRGCSEARDARVKMLSGVLHGIKVTKLLAWEEPLLAVLRRLRADEMRFIRTRKIITVIMNCIDWTAPVLLPMLLFAGAIATGREVTASVAFSSLAILDRIQGPMNQLPRTLTEIVNLLVGVERVKQLLLGRELQTDTDEAWRAYAEEQGAMHAVAEYAGGPEVAAGQISSDAACLERTSSSRLLHAECGRYCRAALAPGQPAIEILPGTRLKWPDDQAGREFTDEEESAWSLVVEQPLLAQAGAMVHVCGSVGSGKSTLLQALLGEVQLAGGGVAVRGHQVTYCQQEPWIQAATIRDNILFGHAHDPERLEAVIEACGLSEDLEQFELGEFTPVGERGVTLSGGQRARLALARACYPNPDIIVLDDILSAVDARIGRHLVQRCLCGPDALLRGSTRVLATPAGGLRGLLPPPDASWRIEDGAVVQEAGAARGRHPEADTFGVYGAPEGKIAGSLTPAAVSTIGDAASVFEQEERETGAVRLQIWLSYFRVLGWGFVAAGIPLYGMSVGTVMASNFILAQWTDATAREGSDHGSDMSFLAQYVGVLLGSAACVFVRNCLFAFVGSLRASRKIHDAALPAVVHAPMSFFYATPVGRIINRFSADLEVVDFSVMPPLQGLSKWTYDVVLGVGAVLCVMPPLTILLFPAFVLYRNINNYHRVTGREGNRLGKATRSTFVTFYEELLHGAAHVRAWGAEGAMCARGEDLRRPPLKLGWIMVNAERWKTVRLALVANSMMLLAAVYARFAAADGPPQASPAFVPRVSAGLLGVMLKYVTQITNDFGTWINMFTEVELNLVCVERLVSYAKLAPELQDGSEWTLHTAPSVRFVDVELSYGKPGSHEIRALQGVSFHLGPGSSLGICGRTGAGKSSLVSALFRLTDLRAGQILFDEVDTAGLRLRDLRRGIGSIPQEPLLFAGSLRFNLDPGGLLHPGSKASDDAAIWSALGVLGLAGTVRDRGGLDMRVEVDGDNLSAGERQLLTTARALLQRPVLLVLDEATANVDEATEQQIMAAVRKEGGGVTTLSIAHRVRTLFPLDQVMVLEHGRVLEFGEPTRLLQDPTSAFSKLVHAATAEAHGFTPPILGG